MSGVDLIIRGPNVVLPDTIAPRSVHVRDGKIVETRGFVKSAEGSGL